MAKVPSYVPKVKARRPSTRRMVVNRMKFWQGMKFELRTQNGLHPLATAFVATMLLAVSLIGVVSLVRPVTLDVKWGLWDTLDDVDTGVHGDVTHGDFTFYSSDYAESIVIDNVAYLTAIGDVNETMLLYEPSRLVQDNRGWNLSFESFLPKNWAEVRYTWDGNTTIGLSAYLLDASGDEVAGVKLVAGNVSRGTIKVLNASSGAWTNVSSRTIGNNFHRSADYGYRPDTLIVSFSQEYNSTKCDICVFEAATKKVLFHAKSSLPAGANMHSPSIRFDVESRLKVVGGLPSAVGWMLDNFAIRSIDAGYLLVNPMYEVVAKGENAWLKVTDQYGNVLNKATVTIGGQEGFFSRSTNEYRVNLPLPVSWADKVNLTVVYENMLVSDWIDLSIKPALDESAEYIPMYWNGWSWASVAGTDDCFSPTEGIEKWFLRGFDHPITVYIADTLGGGTSSQLLPTQSEIGMHYPHDFYAWAYKNWEGSLQWAEYGHSMVDRAFEYASRWDNPAYVGKGDTFISVGCPGNGGSIPLMYAHYAAGTRFQGGSTNDQTAQGHSLYGSWHLTPGGESIDSQSWQPIQPINLMDAQRQWETMHTLPWSGLFDLGANGGVLRMYSHYLNFSNIPMVNWIVREKTNSSYENWKATDGEVASYIFASKTTDLVFNDSTTTETEFVWDISRQSPYPAGFWNVPVTLAFNITSMDVADVQVIEGSQVYSTALGTLQNLSGARVMDVGYDIRTDYDNCRFEKTLFISHFFNESAQVRIIVKAPAANAGSLFVDHKDNMQYDAEYVCKDDAIPLVLSLSSIAIAAEASRQRAR